MLTNRLAKPVNERDEFVVLPDRENCQGWGPVWIAGQFIERRNDFGIVQIEIGKLPSLQWQTIADGIEVALVTDDVTAAVRSAVDAGARLIAEPHQKPWGQTVGYVRAPAANCCTHSASARSASRSSGELNCR